MVKLVNPKVCVVCGRPRDADVKLYGFPRNAKRRIEWLKALNMMPWGENEISRAHQVCGRHFKTACFSDINLKLNQNAEPSLLPWVGITVGNIVTTGSTTSLQPNCAISSLTTQTSTRSTPNNPLPSTSKSVDESNFAPPVYSRSRNELPEIISQKLKYLTKLKLRSRQKSQKLKDLLNEDSPLIREVFNNLKPTAVTLMLSQLHCAKKAPKGRSWTNEDKVICLSLYKHSRKSYMLLRRLLTLPSIRTLQTVLSNISFQPGINNHIFEHLRQCLNNLSAADRLCTLMFDEMSIRQHIEYNSFTGVIEGLEDYGDGKCSDHIADRALVFMAQGIRKTWKQPLAYYFSHGPVKSQCLTILIRQVLDAMAGAKLHVVAIISDMDSAKVEALSMMRPLHNQYAIIHNNQEIPTIFDPPHLIKNTRNMLEKYSISVPVEIGGRIVAMKASWSDIRVAWEKDRDTPICFRSLHKITKDHIDPNLLKKMKVSLATQVLSHSMSARLYALVTTGALPQAAMGTATFVAQADQLFDSFNGTGPGPAGKEVRCLLSDDSPHRNFWGKAVSWIQQWRCIEARNNDHLPVHRGWVHSMHAIMQVWVLVKRKGLNYIRPRSFNQDPLENLFGSIRTCCANNENPTVRQFIASFKTQIINGLSNRGLTGTNCEADEISALSDLRSIVFQNSHLASSESENILSANAHTVKIITDIEKSVFDGKLEALSVAYVSGFIAKKLLSEVNSCEVCQHALISNSSTPRNLFISYKVFSDQDKLFYPTETLARVVGHGITLMENELKVKRSGDVKKKAVHIISECVDFSFITCQDHFELIKRCIVGALVNIGLKWHCTRVVRDLKLS